jgi:DNA repair protein RadA/Sms
MYLSKQKSIFVCQECGHNSPRWLGKCPACGEWNTFVEEIKISESLNSVSISDIKPVSISEIKDSTNERSKTYIKELDRVLGGGIVNGSLILIGGDPGIGKSTLLLQVSNNYADASGSVLYVSGEESKEQIKIRANRLGLNSKKLYIISETNQEKIEQVIMKMKPDLIIIDSIQTVYLSCVTSAPGSVTQVRECTNRFMNISKKNNIPIFIVGHVTKSGALAGPRVLEHIVDTVLYFEGSGNYSFRVLRAVKNRFGSTNEIGVFQMEDNGLKEVANPSGLFLSERPNGVSGSVVTSTLEGTRPVLIEIQALVSDSPYGTPRRLTTGLELNRVLLMTAVLEKKLGMMLGNQDIYMNSVGGIKAVEPAIDLGICIGIVSSFKNISVDSNIVVVGEVGLSGEVRAVPQVNKRVKEAVKMGFSKIILPQKNLENIISENSLELIGVKDVRQALEIALGG